MNFEPLTYNQRPTFVNPHFVMVADKQLNWEKSFNLIRNSYLQHQ
ncbi:CysQ-like protein [Actinobacillus equuli]|nr:CysQ-like protein [Actinobacillus equuli]